MKRIARKLIFILGSGLTLLLIVTRPPILPTPSNPSAQPKTHQNTAAKQMKGDGSGKAEKGIDVSHFQGNVNWKAVAQTDVVFAYAKASEGVTYVDRQFVKNQRGASAHGINFGAYHFYRPNDDPLKQAKHFLAQSPTKHGSLPPVLDLEISPKGGDIKRFQKDVLSWLEHVKSATDCTPAIYASPSFWTKYLGEGFSKYPYWLAEYSTVAKPPATAPDPIFWQYSPKGTVGGVDGLVDSNRSFGTKYTEHLCVKGEAE